MIPVNYWAVLIAAIASLGLGFLWYGPMFGKQWMALMGINPEHISEAAKKSMKKNYLITFLGSFLMAYVLEHSLIFASAYTNIGGVDAGISAAIWSWIGFIVPVTLGSVLWEGKPWKLWFINSGYYLVALLVMGIILALGM